MQHLVQEKIDEIDNQYRSILYVNWQESGTFEDGIPTDTVSFWSLLFTLLHSVFVEER
jgi:hypothetical protein